MGTATFGETVTQRWENISTKNECFIIINEEATDSGRYGNISNDPLFNFSENLRFYGRPTIYTLGIIFNTLAIAVFCRKALRRTTTCMFMTSVAIFDIMNLVNGFFFWIQYDLNTRTMTGSIIVCKMVVFTLYFAPEASAILLSAMSVERYIKIRHPIRARKLCSATRVRITIVTIVTVLFLLNLPIFFAHIYMKFPHCEEQVCWNIFHDSPKLMTHEKHITEYFVDVHKWIAAAMYWLIPTATLLIFNTLIILEVRKRNKERKSVSKRASVNNQITNMLLVVTFSFLVMTTGYNTIQTGIVNIWMHTDDEGMAKISLFFTVCTLLFYLNHASNFFLYCISGQKYRETLKQVISQCLCCNSKGYRRVNKGMSASSSQDTIASNSCTSQRSVSESTTIPKESKRWRYYGSTDPDSAWRLSSC